jgi:hypothetical protein
MKNLGRELDQSEGLGSERRLLVERRYRVTADVVIQVHDITPETVHNVLSGSTNYDEIIGEEWPWAQARASRELLREIIKTPEILDRLFKEKAVVEVQLGEFFDEKLRKAVSPDGLDEDEFVQPVVKSLSSTASELLQEAIEQHYYPEATEQLTRAIDSRVDTVSVIDVTKT